MPSPLTNRVIAFAGALQAADLVRRTATTGHWPDSGAEASIGAILGNAGDDVAALFGGSGGVGLGLRLVDSLLAGGADGRDPDVTRYLVGILHLERKLHRNRAMLQTLADGIARARAQAAHFSTLHENVLANLADLYVNTISTLGPRLLVKGEPQLLNQPATQHRVRAMLLAGIRAAALWRHHGGSKWHLLLQRRKMVDEARRLLAAA